MIDFYKWTILLLSARCSTQWIHFVGTKRKKRFSAEGSSSFAYLSLIDAWLTLGAKRSQLPIRNFIICIPLASNEMNACTTIWALKWSSTPGIWLPCILKTVRTSSTVLTCNRMYSLLSLDGTWGGGGLMVFVKFGRDPAWSTRELSERAGGPVGAYWANPPRGPMLPQETRDRWRRLVRSMLASDPWKPDKTPWYPVAVHKSRSDPISRKETPWGMEKTGTRKKLLPSIKPKGQPSI